MPAAEVSLSVVLPVHDGEQYLDDALASLVRNDRPDFEIVAVDDGSDDATPAVLDSFRDALPRLRVIRNESALGVSASRNLALGAARGRFVTFVDADDWLAPGYLPQLVEAIDTLGCDFVRVDHVKAQGRERVLHRAPCGPRGVVLDPREHILPLNVSTMVDYAFPWAGVYRRELGELLRLDPALHTAADRPWTWRMHREAASFAVVSLAGVFYRRDVTTSLTRLGDRRRLHFLDAYRRVFDELDADPQFLPKAVRQFVALFAHHVDQVGRRHPELADELGSRGRTMLAELPRDVVASAPLSEDRAALVGRYLPRGLASRRVSRRSAR